MKITMPTFRPTKKSRPQKLDAAARRATAPAHDEYDDEPTMRLSSALIIVFILHLVAAGGLWAFSISKEKHSAEQANRDINSRLSAPAAMAENQSPAQLAAAGTKPSVKSSAEPSIVKDSGETYVVVKGDNPVTIAKRYGVKEDDLMKLNHITDSRRLRIGQKLHLPAKPRPAKPE